ncbi:DUF748 domain-containing protein [Porticoccus sp. GXU_MW_L64]
MRKAFRIFLYSALVYLLLATFAVPPILNWQLKEIFQQQTGRQLVLAGSWLNPLSLEVGLEGLAIHDPDGKSLASFDELVIVPAIWRTLSSEGFYLRDITLTGFYGHLRVLGDGEYSFADILRHQQALPPSENTEPGEPPVIYIDSLSIDARQLAYTDMSGPEPVSSRVSLSVDIANVRLPEKGPLDIDVSGRIQESGRFTLAGKLALQSLNGQLQLGLQLPLADINGFLAGQINGRLRGLLSTDLALEFNNQSLAKISGSSQIDNLSVEADSGEPLLVWQQLAIDDLQLDAVQQRASVERLALKKPHARFAIDADGNTNLQGFMGQGLVGQGLVGQGSTGEAEADNSGSGSPWQLAIKEVAIDNGQLAFSDASLAQPFAASLEQLSGTVTGFHSSGDQAAVVSFKGLVDEYAPIALSGTLGPTAPSLNLDLAFELDALEVPSLSPYSGTYVGRAIDQGQLQLTLGYQVKDNRLKGQNKVRIEQLSLGKKVDSPNAVSLPLGAAVALLKDVSGVINMNVPVSGDLADPSFIVSSVVWSAFQNLIVKTVASPFKLLGSLVGAEDDLQRVPFAPGAVTLSERSREKVAMLALALAKRPSLKLTLQGQYDPEKDGALLQQRQLDKRLQKAGIDEQSRTERDERWSKAVVQLYRRVLPDRDMAERPASALYDELLGHQAIDPAALLMLAESRAQAVLEQLLALGVAADRASLKQSTKKSAKGAQVVLDI